MSVTAFVGYFKRGPMNRPELIRNFGDFEHTFGGLDPDSEASYSIKQFFLNGGTEALVIRTAKTPTTASVLLTKPSGDEILTVRAANPGAWGNNLRLDIDHETRNPDVFFNLTVGEYSSGALVQSETFRNLSLLQSSSRFIELVLREGSELIEIEVPATVQAEVANQKAQGDPLTKPAETVKTGANRWQYEIGLQGPTTTPQTGGRRGDDGEPPGTAQLIGTQNDNTGLYALEDADLFNILCIPRTAKMADTEAMPVLTEALDYCVERRAFMIVDIPEEIRGVEDVKEWVSNNRNTLRSDQADHAALYFPQINIADPLHEFRSRTIGISGTLAGLYARVDADRGVWKAPAGIEATLRGVRSLDYELSSSENSLLNPLGINALRSFDVRGTVVWGARTLRGADRLAGEYKYIPVRRLALFIEESLFRGLQWVVFEPNGEPLWAQIRTSVTGFLQQLFRQGAFQGSTPNEAYFVKCDRETTTQADIDRGIVNVVVGFAPLKPAEFVLLKIQLEAGQHP